MKSLWMLWSALAAVAVLAQERDIMPRPPRPVASGNALAALVRDTRVGEAQRYKNLMVYPLFTAGRARQRYWTMDEALARGSLRITEKGEGNVPQLLVENRGDEPVFLLAGEIVKGGKQNRVVSQDILLAPHTGPISLSVFCVEQHRWAKSTASFGAEKQMAHSNLRQQLNAPMASQSGVWGEVARKADAVAPKAAGGTAYLGQVFDDKDVKRDVEEYAARIRLPQEANGMAVVIGGRVVGAELFGDAETFGRLRDKLLRSYATDAIEYRGADDKVWADTERVERFLRRVENARLVLKETVGIGQFFSVEGGGLYGSTLVWQEQRGAHGVVHASLFDEQPVIQPAK